EPIKVLFSIGPFKVYSWGTMFIIAFLTAFFLMLREGKRKGINDNHIYNLAFLVLLGSLIGPRVFYVLEHINYYIQKPLEVFFFWQGGVTSYGAFLGLLFVWLYTRKQKDITFGQILDLVAPYILLAIAIVRVGCFLNWDDLGRASSLPWAIKVDNDFARHPTQLYESVYSLISFFILIGFKKVKEKSHDTRFKKLLQKHGSMFLFFLLFYSFFRFFNDFLREYETNLFGLALSQWICLTMFILSSVMLYALYHKKSGL
ncbi:MAG: prolipoprotein diacylglyceryl transferase, partial [Candidatus Pacearchaeota archaeon]|nr:prolipoprotein diacylglyceryl transferase [Candidatus Pacearchaeota archaeon]